MCQGFVGIRQGCEVGCPVLSLQSAFQDGVAKKRILGKDGAVTVGTEDVFITHALCAVFAVVSISFDDLS